MGTIKGSKSNQSEITEVNLLLEEIIEILKEDTKAAENRAKQLVASFAEGGKL